MRLDTNTVQEFLLEWFLYEGYVHTWECFGWNKTENLIDGVRRGGGGGGGGVY